MCLPLLVFEWLPPESFKLFICGAVGCVLHVDAAALGEEWWARLMCLIDRYVQPLPLGRCLLGFSEEVNFWPLLPTVEEAKGYLFDHVFLMSFNVWSKCGKDFVI